MNVKKITKEATIDKVLPQKIVNKIIRKGVIKWNKRYKSKAYWF